MRPVPDERALQLDLRKLAGGPGTYRIQGKWDWDTVKVAGTVRLHKLDDLKTAQLTPESQDRLIAGIGSRAGGPHRRGFPLRRSRLAPSPQQCPPAPRGPARNTSAALGSLASRSRHRRSARQARILLALSRIDGATTDMPLRVLPAVPRLESPGPRVNVGQTRATRHLHRRRSRPHREAGLRHAPTSRCNPPRKTAPTATR